MRSTPWRLPVGRVTATLALALVLALSGCGGGDGGDGDATAEPDATTQAATPSEEGEAETSSDVPDLCALVTAEEFRAVTGAGPGEPDATPASGAVRGMCTWPAEGGFPILMIGAYNASDREQTLALVDAEPVDGLGTEAHWAVPTGLLLVVADQDWYLQVLVSGTDDDKAASVAAAGIVLENLGP